MKTLAESPYEIFLRDYSAEGIPVRCFRVRDYQEAAARVAHWQMAQAEYQRWGGMIETWIAPAGSDY
jgi:hypothetical protein